MDEAADRRGMGEAADKGMVVTEKRLGTRTRATKRPFTLFPLFPSCLSVFLSLF